MHSKEDIETKQLWQTITDTRHQVSTMRQEFYEVLKKIEVIEAAVEELRIDYGSNKKQA